jgi:hypothetical protein
MPKKRIIHINTTDGQCLEKGAQEVVDMLRDIETFIAKRSQRVCATCGDLEWMNPGESVCWRCWRISQGLAVAKPKSEAEYCWWNYIQKAWVPLPTHPPEGSEWGKREEYK